MANDIIPYQAPQPPALIDTSGRPLRQAAAIMAREVSAPTMAGIRSIYSSHPAQGLDPLRLTQILRSAENGDATAYLELAEEMEEKDLHYLGILSTRKRQVSQLPITVEAVSDDPEDEADAKLVRDWTERPTLQLELFDILDAIGKGYSATEIIWDTADTPWVPGQLKWRFPQFFEYDRVTGEQLLLKGGEDAVAGQPEPLRPYKYVVHQAQAKSGLPIRGGLARIAAWGYLFKNFTIKDWMTFLEVYGLPLRVGKYQNGTSEDDIRKLAQAVAQIGSDAGAVIPASMMMEFVQGNGGTANPEMFRNMCQYLDDALSKAVLGQTSSADAKSGGLGSGQADLHSEVRKDIESADAAQLSATLMRDLVVPIVMFNRGKRKRYPRLLVGRPDPIDVKQALEAIGLALDFGIPVGMSYFRKVSGIPEPKPGEELLAKATAQAAQEPQDGPNGASGAEKGSTDLLTPFKRPKSDIHTDEVAAAAQVEREADAIDRLVDGALGEWPGLIAGALDPIDALIEQAASLEELRELLAVKAGDVIAAMDVAAIARMGERAGFGAKVAGLIDRTAFSNGVDIAALYNPRQPRVPRGSRDGGEWTNGRSGGLISTPAPTNTIGAGGGSSGSSTKLTSAEKRAVGDYSLMDYKTINEQARGEAHYGSKTQRKIDIMDAAVAKGAISEPTTLYRGVSGPGVAALKAAGLSEGSMIRDPGFLSTSRSKDIASANFAEAKGSILIAIKVKKGTRALDAAKHSNLSFEQEVIFPRNAAMRVTKYDKRSRTLHVEVDDE